MTPQDFIAKWRAADQKKSWSHGAPGKTSFDARCSSILTIGAA
jgi:hypothetical protein